MGFSHNDQSYFLMLEILGRARNLNAARNLLFSIEKKSNGAVKLEDRFFNSLIRNYGRAGLFQESIKLFTTMKSLGVSPSVVSFNSLLSILLKKGRTNMAKNVYDEMLSMYGVTPDTYTFNILIRGFCMNSMVDEGYRFFKDMSGFRCDPDVITYNTLVDGLCRAGKVEIAHNVVKGMSKRSGDLTPNVVTYTTLIRGYCAKQEIDKALCILEEMTTRGLKPNGFTYNTLIKGLCEAQKLDKIKEILEGTMIGGEFTPDTCTFNTLMHSHCNAGNLDEALKVFAKMSELKVPPDSATYSVLIRSLCQRGDYPRAEELFDELSEKEILLRDDGCKPLVASYNPIFGYLSSNGKTQKAEEVFRQLMRRGTQDPLSYKTLIMGNCKEGTYEAGYELLVWMLRRDFVPDEEIYVSLIDGLLQKGKPLLAQQTLEKMLKSSHLPQTSTFHSLLAELLKQHCARESASFVTLMLEKKIRQNIISQHILHQQLPCLDSLKSALEVAGRSVEAEFLSKRIPRQQLLDKSGKSRLQLISSITSQPCKYTVFAALLIPLLLSDYSIPHLNFTLTPHRNRWSIYSPFAKAHLKPTHTYPLQTTRTTKSMTTDCEVQCNTKWNIGKGIVE
ncbi:pentatricopeptide repeat-containing protein [Prunus yedoensis var. nudiflora]|uniref:Pentatricopeptide repeat-containing protein n=1 Tax=Prunus yedoensis var. nudiflora TaxID=2094558 RepID=A0A314Y5P2_PRUYE|nr:pentatricopeptide repeat-containing protein [Prunus yedoensis var. nudiflora]